MALWQRNLDIRDVWPTRNIPLISKTIASKLRALEAFGVEEIDAVRDDLATQFETLTEDLCDDTEEFDAVMEQLYDWGDKVIGKGFGLRRERVCWIATGF